MPNWCHNTLTVSGDEHTLKTFVEAVRDDERPLSFAKIVPQVSDEELRKLERYQPCTMCGAHGMLPDSEEQAAERGARWYPWMAERIERTCNVCGGSKEERVGGEGWYEWRLRAWGTKWDANFTGPGLALGHEGSNVDLTVETQGATVTPTVVVYKFDTAWSPPEPVVRAASERHPDLEFVLRFGEPGDGFAGQLKCVAGLVIETEKLEVEEVLAPEEMWF
jgi:hypothetical protein